MGIRNDINLFVNEYNVHNYELGNHVFSFDNPGHDDTSPFENEEDYLFFNLVKIEELESAV